MGERYLWRDQGGDLRKLLAPTSTRLTMSESAAEMPDDPGFAALTAMPKVVFSSTLEELLSWANTHLVDGDPVEAVRAIKG